MMFIVAAQWSLLGAIIADNFVYYPNLLGSILTGLQLSLFLVFPSYTSGSEKKMEPTDEQLI